MRAANLEVRAIKCKQYSSHPSLRSFSLRAGFQWKKLKRTTEDANDLTENQLKSAIQGALQVLSHEETWVYKFGISDIDLCSDVVARSPGLFESYIVSADVINLSQEEVLNTISEVFADGGKSGIPELGVGNAEDLVIYNAWQRHMVLYENSMRYKRSNTIVFMLLLLVGFLTTVCSVMYSYLKGNYDYNDVSVARSWVDHDPHV